MEDLRIRVPEISGRGRELERLKKIWKNALSSAGHTILISGEAGIGKTRLPDELIRIAESDGAKTIRGWCLSESLEPLMPVRSAFRDANLSHLVSGEPPPLLVSLYLINDAGMLIASSEREETDLDADIFASMLQAVGEFVKDSLSMMNRERGESLNSLGYGKYRIIIRSGGTLSLVAVMKGTESEALIEDMGKILKNVMEKAEEWSGEVSEEIADELEALQSSGKYEGMVLVDDPKIKQQNLFDNILMGIVRESGKSPVLLFLDDLHWADPTTLNLLHYLARNIRRDRILIIGTYRPEDIIESDGRVHPLANVMRKMSREELFDGMELKRLDEESTKKIIDGALGNTDFGDSFYGKIYEETEGTPFFVLEVVKLLAEEGAITQDSGIWRTAGDLEKMEIPSRIYDVVERRLNRLMEEHRDMLECASVIGEEFSTDILGNLTGTRRVVLLRNLGKIEKNHRLIHYLKNRYRFDHTKIWEVLYEGIPEELRREYHGIVAEILERCHSENPDDIVEDVAYHYHRAEDEKAKEYLIRAGDKAAESYANEEALTFYENSLGYLEEKEKPDVMEKMGDVLTIMGEYEKAIEVFKKAAKITEDGETEARFHRKISVALERKGDYEKAIKELECGESLVSKHDREYWITTGKKGYIFMRKGEYERSIELNEKAAVALEGFKNSEKDIGDCYNTIGACYYSRGDYDAALNYFDIALKIRKKIGDQYGAASSYNNFGVVLSNKGENERALEFYEKSLKIKERIGDRYGVASLYNNIGLVLSDKGENERALEFYKKGLEIKEKIGDRSGVANLYDNIGIILLNRAETDQALEYHEKSLEIRKKIGDLRGIALAYTNIGIIFEQKGELDTAMEFYEKSLKIKEKIGDRMGIALVSINIGYVAYCRRDYQKAEEWYERSIGILRKTDAKKWLIDALYGLADTYINEGKVDGAESYMFEAKKLAVTGGMKSLIAMGDLIYGKILSAKRGWEDAANSFSSAREIFRELGMERDVAIADYHWGSMLLKKGESDRGTEMLRRAIGTFRDMGIKLWVERCRETLDGI